MADTRPIGVFDSGLGGLTVLKALIERFPDESFIYLGDTARLPYGSKSPATIKRYLDQNISFLTRLDVKAVVVACNSASSVLTANERFSVPVYGVIEPGAKTAVEISKQSVIGVVGTAATIRQGAYRQAILKLNPDAKVVEQACPLLVPLVEEGWIDDPVTGLILHRYLGPLLANGIDTLILGCTHYPILRTTFERVCGKSVSLVDSAQAISEILMKEFEFKRLSSADQGPGTRRLLFTDLGPALAPVIRYLLPHLDPNNLEHVDLNQ